MAAFKRVSVVLISGVGALLLFIGLTYDYWDPNRYPGFGYKQFTVTFIGAILVAIPIIYLHCCPVKSRIESIGWGHRGIRLGSRMAGVPVKGAFCRIA